MYIMCLFQQLPTNAMLIEDHDEHRTVNGKFVEQRSMTMSTSTSSSTTINSNDLLVYQNDMERTVQWIVQLEEKIDRDEPIAVNDLKQVKEQFQQHEVTDSIDDNNLVELL
jgi:hypothetical protein